MSTDGPLIRVGRRECGVRLALSLAKSVLDFRTYPDPQQGTLRTRVRVQYRLIGQFGAPQARQNVPAPSMRHCGLGVYRHSAVHTTVHWLGEGPVVQHEGVLKTPRTLRSRARLSRCAHQRKGRKHSARGAERLRGGCGERGLIDTTESTVDSVVSIRDAGGLCVHCGCCCSTAVSRCACLRQLKPPGGSTRSMCGAAGSRRTGSC